MNIEEIRSSVKYLKYLLEQRDKEIVEQQQLIRSMQQNENSAIKIMKMYEKEKKKNQKAVEYIKNNKYIENDDDFILGNEVVPVKKLLDILKGEDKE